MRCYARSPCACRDVYDVLQQSDGDRGPRVAPPPTRQSHGFAACRTTPVRARDASRRAGHDANDPSQTGGPRRRTSSPARLLRGWQHRSGVRRRRTPAGRPGRPARPGQPEPPAPADRRHSGPGHDRPRRHDRNRGDRTRDDAARLRRRWARRSRTRGRPRNRVNYVILGDGYTRPPSTPRSWSTSTPRWRSASADPIGQPYLRYRKFVNICALKIVSENNGVARGRRPLRVRPRFDCGERNPGTNSRLAECDTHAAMAALTANLPASFMVDWHAIMLNNSEWWNTGAAWMLWSGAQPGRGRRGRPRGRPRLPPARGRILQRRHRLRLRHRERRPGCERRLQPGQHDQQRHHHRRQVADVARLHPGGRDRRCRGRSAAGSGPYRPSMNSMMNSLFGNNVNTSFNSVSREKMVMDIWRNVRPDRLDRCRRRARRRTRPRCRSTSSIRRSSTSTGPSTAPSSPRRAARPSTSPDAASAPAATRSSARAYDNAGPGAGAPDDRHRLRPHELGAVGADGDLDGQHSLTWPRRATKLDRGPIRSCSTAVEISTPMSKKKRNKRTKGRSNASVADFEQGESVERRRGGLLRDRPTRPS